MTFEPSIPNQDLDLEITKNNTLNKWDMAFPPSEIIKDNKVNTQILSPTLMKYSLLFLCCSGYHTSKRNRSKINKPPKKKKKVRKKNPLTKILVAVLEQTKDNSNLYYINKLTEIIPRDFTVPSYGSKTVQHNL